MKRRTFVENTLTGMLGVGISPSLLAATENSNKALVDSVIYVYLEGGITHLDTFDPKDNKEVAGETRPIETGVPGLRLGHNLSKLATIGNHLTVINSMNSKTGAHGPGQYITRTSYRDIGTITHPTLGAWAAYYNDKNTIKPLPDYVAIRRPSRHPGNGWMSAKFAPIDVVDPERGLEYSKITVTDDILDKRLGLLSDMNNKFKPGSQAVKDYAEFYDQAFNIVASSELDVFDLKKEEAALRDSYGRDQFGQALLLSRRLVEKGVKFVEVTHGGWDTHTENFNAMDTKLPVLDNALFALVQDLKSRGLLEKTMIVLATEFGRTPKINVNNGRDHFPGAYSSALIGGPLKGKAYGKTDDRGEKIVDKPVSIEELNATIGHALGLPVLQQAFSPNRRPFTPSNNVKPILDILA